MLPPSRYGTINATNATATVTASYQGQTATANIQLAVP